MTIEVASPRLAWFASDMHLDDADEAGVARTARFLAAIDALVATPAPPNGDEASRPALFLLGDLFEFWIGDDAPGPTGDALASSLGRLSGRGWRVFLMHGNRDFLIDAPVPDEQGAAGQDAVGERASYSARCGARLLRDPSLVDVDGTRILLSHGDAWCTDDHKYQQWRAVSRNPAWQQQQLAQPVSVRQQFAMAARQQSRMEQAGMLSDVAQPAVDAAMDAHRVDHVIHGHTHRPAVHRWQRDGRTRHRWVLSDWHADPERGSIRALSDVGDFLAPARIHSR